MNSSKKQKNFDKNIVFGFIVNFCAFFSLALMAGLLVLVDAIDGPKTGTASMADSLPETLDSQGSSCMPTVLFPVSAQDPVEESIGITVSENGFSVSELNMALSSLRMVKITNTGSKPHSFAIDDLGIDSGIINPGQAVVVSLENLPQGGQKFQFYSNISEDTKEKFSGIIIAAAAVR